MITDEVKIIVFAGRGGDGPIAFDKIKMALGPTGGKGGNGGNVYFEGVENITALNKYKRKKEYYASDGNRGGSDRSTGHDGEDIVLTVPIGSVIKNLTTNQEREINQIGEKILAAKGGLGGRGNFYFRSPVNTSPERCEEGKSGESFPYQIELRLIADAGFIGLPNVGKSSLLNELTKAQAKVANYEFTTLEPNLGALEKIILADIPGLIEGAAEGRGLGIKFLKHIRRTKALLHCIAADSENLKKDYEIVRRELKAYDEKLMEKPEMIILTRTDLVSPEQLQEAISILQSLDRPWITVSIHDWDSLENLKKSIRELIKQ